MVPQPTRSRSGEMSSPQLAVGGVRIRPTSRTLVVPATPTEEHWLSLSNLDRVVNPTFSSVILFYTANAFMSNAQRRSFEDVCGILKGSLARVLVEFYPLAGRLALREDGLVDLHCNDEGAIFIEASVDADLDAVGGPKPMPTLSGLEVARLGPGPHYIPDQLRPMPTLVVMVTKFACSSIAIAANWHHSVADGSSGCHFMESWAEMATGNDVSLAPNHDRFLLRARDPPNPSLVNGYSTRNIEKLLEDPHESETPTSKRWSFPREPAMLRSFHISKSAVQELKEKVNKADEEARQFSSAHLWQQMTRARADKDPQRNSTTLTRFFMFVDGRKKMNLPTGYFGNVVCSACAVASEEDILRKPLSYAASLIKRATRNISGEYFQSLIDWVEIQGSVPSKSEHVNSTGHDVAATFWIFFPLYEVDFGWGKPDLVARNSPARPLIDGIAMMPSADGPGNMVALLNLHADCMDKLTTQRSFNAIFSS